MDVPQGCDISVTRRGPVATELTLQVRHESEQERTGTVLSATLLLLSCCAL